jgi:NTP pyrophosphatase (non-canonical NTP hydrolase)
MDSKEPIETLKRLVIQFRDARDWEQFHDPKNLAMGLSIECAELQEVFLWKRQEEIAALLKQEAGYNKVKEELADIFVFLLYLAEGCKVDLSEAVREKISINEKKYPVDRFYGSNKKYDHLG